MGQGDRLWVLAERDAIATLSRRQFAGIRSCVAKSPELPTRPLDLEIKATTVIQGFTRPSMLALQSGQPIDGLVGTHFSSDGRVRRTEIVPGKRGSRTLRVPMRVPIGARLQCTRVDANGQTKVV